MMFSTLFPDIFCSILCDKRASQAVFCTSITPCEVIVDIGITTILFVAKVSSKRF